MSSVKEKLLEEIERKVKRKNKLKQEIASRQNNIEEFVLKMINEIDEMISATVNTSLGPVIAKFYIKSIRERIRTLDEDANIEISWADKIRDGNLPRLNGVLIKWSPVYQKANACDPELFVDIAALLFK